MSKAPSSKRDLGKVDVGGSWQPLLIEFLQSRACAGLSPHAVKLLFLLIGQMGTNGYNNGRLDLSKKTLLAAGWTGDASARAVMRELTDANLLVCTQKGRKGTIGLFAVSLYPMNCKTGDLEVGKAAWAIADWRSAPAASEKPTVAKPALWHRPRAGEKHIRTSRSGNESPSYAPAAGTNALQNAASFPVAGAHSGKSAPVSIPLRAPLYRRPSAATAGNAATTAARQRLLLERRAIHGPHQQGYLQVRLLLSQAMVTSTTKFSR